MTITFQKAMTSHLDTIWRWLQEPHVMEFWDNTQGHKDDIINFVNGRKTPSSYCDGLYSYWIGYMDETPYCMVMTIQEKPEYDMHPIQKEHLSKAGYTYSLDFMIGEKEFFGKGFGAKTLSAFVDFIKCLDPKADTFLIDPEDSNVRAQHVYAKAGFNHVGDFIRESDCSSKGKTIKFFVKKIF